MPLMWLRAHTESLRELQAEEAFRMAEAISVGAFKLDRAELHKVTSRWRAELGQAENGHRPKTRSELSAAARIMGFGVRQIGPR